LQEAGDRLFTFTRPPLGQWRSARTTNAIERLHEEFKRRSDVNTPVVFGDYIDTTISRVAVEGGVTVPIYCEKAIVVCLKRRICVALYDAIVKLRPRWHSDDDEAGAIKVVRREPRLIGRLGNRTLADARRSAGTAAKRAKEPADFLKLVVHKCG
jgi:type I site-specific restriction-modification system R (restriction) subunit